MRVLTHPAVATALFIGSLYGLYFTGLFDTLMTNHLGHAAMELHFLLVGCLFFYVLIGVDPSPRKLPPFAALALLLIVMPFHAFFSIAIMSSSTVLGEDFFTRLDRPYSTDLLADQNLGGSISWALGELPIIAVVAAIFIQWWRSDYREARRHDRAEDRKAAAGDSDLERYNAYLAQLHARDAKPSRRDPSECVRLLAGQEESQRNDDHHDQDEGCHDRALRTVRLPRRGRRRGHDWSGGSALRRTPLRPPPRPPGSRRRPATTR